MACFDHEADPTQETLTSRYIGKTLVLTHEAEKEVKSLAIAPGGNIIQNIKRDTTNPRIWDVANSKILNVQLIDSRTFRIVTGMDPPATPITPDTYKQMGLPFYQLWQDESKASGVAGKWGAVNGAMAVASANMKSTWTNSIGGSEVEETTPHGETGGSEVLEPAFSKKGKQKAKLSGVGMEDFKEPSFDFPIVLLDVDDTVPKFKSVVEKETEERGWNWADDEELYD
jgi:hypothetical protein